MKKVLINLDRSTERLETFYRVNKHIEGVERFSAIEGKGLRQPLKQSGLLLEYGNVDYTDGALGCALSHAEQWRLAISSGGGRTVIEDDAVFCKNFEEEHKRLLNTLPETWDIILWGYNLTSPLSYDLLPIFFSCMTLDSSSFRENIGLYPNTYISSGFFKLIRVIGTPCYSISPKGAQKFLEFCFPIRLIEMSPSEFCFPMRGAEMRYPSFSTFVTNVGIDVSMAALYPQVEAYICTPPLVVTSNDKTINQILR